MDQQKLIAIFDRQAAQYDRQRESAFQRRWRQELLSHARGEVLELAVGAGGNFPFYPASVSVTAADFSPAMLAKAKAAAARYGIAAEFHQGDVERMDFPEAAFDTVVSTLSLCGYENPARMLATIRRSCKPDGQILLIEHGLSPNPVLSALQRGLDPLLYRLSGCHHTRNIRELVQEAGLRILWEESRWLDMVRLIRARP